MLFYGLLSWGVQSELRMIAGLVRALYAFPESRDGAAQHQRGNADIAGIGLVSGQADARLQRGARMNLRSASPGFAAHTQGSLRQMRTARILCYHASMGRCFGSLLTSRSIQ